MPSTVEVASGYECENGTSLAQRVRKDGTFGPLEYSRMRLRRWARVISLAPLVRVNGIAPATVVSGSTMFPRDRVIQSLQKYGIGFDASESTEDLRGKLADFYAQRTLTRRPILPRDCANAIVWLLSDDSAKTTGHIIPVDGGLTEAFLR
jgi:NAD(P)-dependent dehydrogenase (short-subunit alcohol dehydrogenase family)